MRSGKARWNASERAKREPVAGVCELCPSGSWGRAHGQGIRGKAPREAESLLNLGGPKEGQNLHTYCLQTVHSESLFKMEIGW